MRITQWGEYGVRCLVRIASHEQVSSEPIGASEISLSQGIALDYAQQILQRLRKGGLIESVRGPSGGYRLSRKPSEITLGDILTAAEGTTFEIICDTKPLDPERCSPLNHCGLRLVWEELREHVDLFLKGVSLETITQRMLAADGLAQAPLQIGAPSLHK